MGESNTHLAGWLASGARKEDDPETWEALPPPTSISGQIWDCPPGRVRFCGVAVPRARPLRGLKQRGPRRKLPGIFWERPQLKVSAGPQYSSTRLTMTIQHTPTDFSELEAEAQRIRKIEGEGARVDHAAWNEAFDARGYLVT
jgi:hypothetical protein